MFYGLNYSPERIDSQKAFPHFLCSAGPFQCEGQAHLEKVRVKHFGLPLLPYMELYFDELIAQLWD